MKDPRKRAANGQRSAHVLSVITDAGMTAKEIATRAGMLPDSVRKPISRLCADGLVFKAKFSTLLVWYFRSEAAAKAFQAPSRLAKVSGFTPPKTPGFDRRAEVVRPAHVKVQKCPGFNGLGFAEPAKVEGGAFASLGIGKYLKETSDA